MSSGKYRVQIVWFGLEGEKLTGESVSVFYADGPKWLEMKLKRVCLELATKQALKRKYSIRL